MEKSIVAIIIGIVCIVIGVFNCYGHIGTLKRKHKKRVKQEDLPVFSKWIGIGTIIIGVGLCLMGILTVVGSLTGNKTVSLVGTVALFVGLIVGGAIGVYTMIKYNKGIF